MRNGNRYGSKVMKRGAGMVEYALLLVAILVIAATAFQSLGKKVGQGAADAQKSFEGGR